ncbi:MAG: NAD(P)/FAD-dependent oxidoreductase [Lachnospiraceae bacterium]|nr:NAD(P)/FAD-dependent oxidoreductase [Lachnospiraceae bacterium]MCI1399085.1 NAD(P)/FAD-dependent oxidoreductase [Lachnospiraceae bacterium]MCI1424965.1 NAD(P)/FAD-dependent oxidoreductase [Lachnospiraceae bacterium]MCI1453658.1 NAD(P)/FAD-dependent oxidoreductase [Lachnospiraceae bacterium]
MENYKIVIIGGGPAGLAAAAAAKKAGEDSILILERDRELGGILNQCIHNGFGLHTFKEELTGPEYAGRFIKEVQDLGIEYRLDTMVLSISGDRVVTAMNRRDGMFQVQAGAVILAMGCRERPRGALNIPGYRPAGIYTAGTAQRLVNIEGFMPGREVVILGSGDIGLIMARRMTLEGAKVKVVAELMPYSGGLKRNIVQCLDDFGIPLKLSHTVVDIEGKQRVEGVTIAAVDGHGKPIPGTEEHYRCDTLLLSCGLIPENELSLSAGVELSPRHKGPVVNESLETSVPGIFACGNVLHVHDLVDYVSEEAANAGRHAAAYVQGVGRGEENVPGVEIVPGDGIGYTVPETVRANVMGDLLTIRFRVRGVYQNHFISVYFDDERVQHRKKQIVAPGEMEQVILQKKDLLAHPDLKKITICLEEA